MQVVGLAGRKGSGKSTVAQHLVDAHGFVELSFATPLKEAALVLDPLIPDYFETDSRPLSDLLSSDLPSVRSMDELKRDKLWGYGLRSLLQKLGDAMRHVDPYIFCLALEDRLEPLLAADARVVISDVRFPEEANRVRMDGPVVYIDRPGHDDGDSHRSEHFDQSLALHTVVNDGSVEDLFAKVDNVLELVRA
jgi:hypothetical protein